MDLRDTIHEMLRLITKKQDAFLSGARTLEVSLGALNILNKLLLRNLSQPLPAEFAKMALPSPKDLSTAKITIENIPALIILGGPRIEKIQPINLSLFRNISQLRIESAKPYLIESLSGLSRRLSYVKVSNALASGDELLEVEDQQDGAWKELKTLDLSDNFMVEIHPLTGTLRNLTDLDLSNNMITRINGIQGCYALQRLRLAGNQIEDLRGASTELGCIRFLDLRKNKISRLDGLEGLLGLEELDLGENRIENFSELSKLGTLPILSSLRLEGNEVTQRKTYRCDVLSIFIRQFVAEIAAHAFCLDGLEPTEDEIYFIESSTPKIYNPIITFSSRAVAHGMDGNNTISDGAITTPVTIKGKNRNKKKRKTKLVNIDPGVENETLCDSSNNDESGTSGGASVDDKAEAWKKKIMEIKEKFGKKWLVGVNEMMNEADPQEEETRNDENDNYEEKSYDDESREMYDPEGDRFESDEISIDFNTDSKGDNDGVEGTENELDGNGINDEYYYNDVNVYDENEDSYNSFNNDFDASKEFVENKGNLTDYSYLLGTGDDTNGEDKEEEEEGEGDGETDSNDREGRTDKEEQPVSAASEYASSSAVITDYSSLVAAPDETSSSSDEEGGGSNTLDENDEDGNEPNEENEEERDQEHSSEEKENEGKETHQEQPSSDFTTNTAPEKQHVEDALTKLQKRIDEAHENPLMNEFNTAFREDEDVTNWVALKVFSDAASETPIFAMTGISAHKKIPTLLIVSNKGVYIIYSDSQKPVPSLKEWIAKKSSVISYPFRRVSRFVVGPWYQYMSIEENGSKPHHFLTPSHTKAHCFVDIVIRKLEAEPLPSEIIFTARDTRLNFTENIIRSKVNKRPAPATILLYAQIYYPEKKKYRTLILTPIRLVMCKENIRKWPLPKAQFTKEKEIFLHELTDLVPSEKPPWTLKILEERESLSVVFETKEDMLVAMKVINYAFYQKTYIYINS